MRQKRLIVLTLGSAAALIAVGLVALIHYHERSIPEPKAQGAASPPRAAGRTDAVAITIATAQAIIEKWGEDVGRDHSAGRAALIALGADWSMYFLKPILRGEFQDLTGNKRLQAIITAKEMGPAARPLVPELLQLYRRSISLREIVEAIRAIGDWESVKEVSGWTEDRPTEETPSKAKA